MARRRHLERAPITEALINFRVELPEGFHPDRFDQLADVFRHRFPKKASQKVLHAGFGVRNGQTLTQAQELQHRGLILKTKRELEIMQLRLDGFTFNRLRPYTSWEQIFPKAYRSWKKYRDHVSPLAVTRLALRYINVLDVPMPKTGFGEYLESPPALLRGAPDVVSGFLTRVVLQDPDSGMSVNLTQALQDAPEPQHVRILVDIDAYKLGRFEGNEELTASTFEQLHELKNRVFFSSITEKTASLFE